MSTNDLLVLLLQQAVREAEENARQERIRQLAWDAKSASPESSESTKGSTHPA